VGLVLDIDDRVLGQAAHAPEQQLRRAFDEHGPTRNLRFRPLYCSIVEGQHAVTCGLDEPEALELVQFLRVVLGQIAGLAPVGRRVVKLPDVVVEGWQLSADQDPRGCVPGDGGPPLVVDPPVSEHLEVLGLVAVGGVSVAE
jgi:hypothetical protein